MRMILASFGIKKSEKALAKELKTTKARGTSTSSFPALALKYKLNYIVKRNATLNDLKIFFGLGYKIIVGYFDYEEKIGHFPVLKAITKEHIYLLGPIFGPNYKLSTKNFLNRWKRGLTYDKDRSWFIGFSA